MLEPTPDCPAGARETTGDRFVVTEPATVRGRHVLVIDDTWASGGRSQSAALALHGAGARSVAVIVLTRWVNPAEEPSGTFVRTRLTRGYDPLICPLGDTHCLVAVCQ
jgi:hypothetical protein